MGATGGLSRRRFLGATLGSGLAVGAGVVAERAGAQAAAPFLHGVASGDPLADAVVIWTRVTPAADAVPGSGRGGPLEVVWEVATDLAFTAIVASGRTTTDATRDHTVHVDVRGLGADRHHWYRFRALGATSPVGRTRTAAAPGSGGCVRFGVATCAEYEFGWFGAYRHLAAIDDLAAVIHLGDYIYEFGIGYGNPPTAAQTPGPAMGRAHEPPRETVSLADYRVRHGQYRSDPDARALHATHPVIVMYDDHEVTNDTWRDGAENHDPPEEGDFATRAAAARQVWREWMPVRQVDPNDPEVVHRRFRFGDLVDLWMLDERRYRDEQPANAFFSYGSVDPAINDPNRTMLGPSQREWLFDGLRSSSATWKVLGNPVPLFPFVVGPALAGAITNSVVPARDGLPPLPPPLTVDDWNGYGAEQRALFDVLSTVEDAVVLTGDYHESFVAEVPSRPGDYLVERNSVAVEFIAPSVTSPGLGETLEAGGLPDARAVEAAFSANLAASNPWVRYHEDRSNGFGVVELGAERAQYDFWYLADRLDRASGAAVAASWEVVRGTAQAAVAAAPLTAAACDPALGGPAAEGPAPAAPVAPPQRPAAGVLPRTGGARLTLGGAAAAAGAAAVAALRAARRPGS